MLFGQGQDSSRFEHSGRQGFLQASEDRSGCLRRNLLRHDGPSEGGEAIGIELERTRPDIPDQTLQDRVTANQVALGLE
jgi:hypothetical protein